jgi:hypothetical protein
MAQILKKKRVAMAHTFDTATTSLVNFKQMSFFGEKRRSRLVVPRLGTLEFQARSGKDN